MTHKLLPPTFALVRPPLEPQPPDPSALDRAIAHVGPGFPSVGAVLWLGWVGAA